MRSFSRWVVGISLLCLLPALLALNGVGEEPKAVKAVRAFSAHLDTNTPVPTAPPAATTTETQVPRPPDAPCPGGPGIWLPSSLDQKQFNDKLALELMYGSDSIAVCPVQDEHSTYPASKLSGQPYFAYLPPNIEGYPVQSVHTVAFIAAATNERQERQFTVITEAASYPGATHQLWGGVFQRFGTEWKTVVSPGLITELGYHEWLGKSLDDRRLEQIGPHRYGVLLRSSSMGQGETGTEAHLIAEVDARLTQVFSAVVAGDNLGGCSPDDPDDHCYAYDSYVYFRECSSGEYWLLYVDTRGTEPAVEDYSVLRDANRVQIYAFRNGAYSLVGSPATESTTGSTDQLAAGSTCGAASLPASGELASAWIMSIANPLPGTTDELSSMERWAILDSLGRPEVVALRKAIDAYASRLHSPYLESPLDPQREWSTGLAPHRDLFTSRYALLAVEPNPVGGANLYVVAKDRPEKVFIAWMVKQSKTWRLRQVWESPVSPDMERRRIAAYKQLLSDPELGF